MQFMLAVCCSFGILRFTTYEKRVYIIMYSVRHRYSSSLRRVLYGGGSTGNSTIEFDNSKVYYNNIYIIVHA